MSAAVVYGIASLASTATCTASFCIGTVEYLKDNSATFLSSKFYQAFPWGWAEEFGVESFGGNDGGRFLAACTWNVVTTYMYAWAWILLIHPAARSAGIKGRWAAIVALGSLVCFGTAVTCFLCLHESKLRGHWQSNDYGSTFIILAGIFATLAGAIVYCVGGYGHLGASTEPVYAGVLLVQALGIFLVYAVHAWKDRSTSRARGIISILISITALFAVGFNLFSYYEMAKEWSYFSSSKATWFNLTFLGDLWVLRAASTFFLVVQEKPALAVVDLAFPPVGVLAMAYQRLGKTDEGRELTREFISGGA